MARSFRVFFRSETCVSGRIDVRSLTKLDPRLLYLAAAMAVNTFGFSLVLPFLSVYLHSEQHVPMEVVGAIYAVAGLAGALGMLVGRELADRRGPRAVMVSTLLARAAKLRLLR